MSLTVFRLATRAAVTAIAALTLTAPSRAAAELHSNASIKRSSSATTGRAGNAMLMTLAMIDKAGNTAIAVASGRVEPNEFAGYIAKAQFRAYDSAGAQVWTDNHVATTQSSVVTYEYTRFVHGQPFEVQANVRGIDGNRTNVVTTASTVLRRPDLAVTRFEATPQVNLGEAINVLAGVAELNGEVGASADCVLRSDGVEIDRASGIWIGPGESAECLFTVVYEAMGQKSLQVSLENVDPGVLPGDWDMANNTATASVSVVWLGGSPTIATFRAGYFDRRGHQETRTEGWYVQSTPNASIVQTASSWANTEIIDQVETGAAFIVNAPYPYVEFPMQMDAMFKIDGVEAHHVDVSVPFAYSETDYWGNYYENGLVQDSTTGLLVMATAAVVEADFAQQHGIPQRQDVFGVQFLGTYRTFLSTGFQNTYYEYADGTTSVHFVNNAFADAEASGQLQFAQQSVSWDVTMGSPGNLQSKSVTVPVVVQTADSYQGPQYCRYSGNATAPNQLTQYSCSQYAYDTTERNGLVTDAF